MATGRSHLLGIAMLDAPTSSAMHHLNMAKAYLDDVRIANKAKTITYAGADFQINLLSKAAQHLLEARVIDPHQTLVYEEDGDTFEFTQDRLNSIVLSDEGMVSFHRAYIAHVDFQKYLDQNDNTSARRAASQGTRYFQEATIAFEKALVYHPEHSNTFDFLSQTYRDLGDKENYIRILKRWLEVNPTNMDARKRLDLLDEFSGALFRPPMMSINRILVLVTIAGLILATIAGPTQWNGLGSIASFMFVIPLIIIWFRWKYL